MSSITPYQQRANYKSVQTQDESFKINCSICGKLCENYCDKWSLCDIKKKNSSEGTKEAIISMVRDENGEQSKAIFRRLSSCSD